MPTPQATNQPVFMKYLYEAKRKYSRADIAAALNVARQSAWAKYTSLEDDEPD